MATGYLARRNELAQERGFQNYYEERKFREETKEERAQAAEALGVSPERGDPNRLVDYYEKVLVPIATEEEITGIMRHDYIAWLIEHEGLTEEEAIDAMREFYGRSPGAE